MPKCGQVFKRNVTRVDFRKVILTAIQFIIHNGLDEITLNKTFFAVTMGYSALNSKQVVQV